MIRTATTPHKALVGSGVEICLGVVGRPPEICLEICPMSVRWVLTMLAAGIIDIGCHIAHRPGKHNHVWGGAQRRTGNGAQASKSWRQRICGQPRSPPYRRGHPDAVACGDAAPATFQVFESQAPRFLSSRQEKRRFDYWQSIMPDLDPPTLGDTEFGRRRGGQELMSTLPYLSPLKFVGRLFTGILS